jgi:hypothetical protein
MQLQLPSLEYPPPLRPAALAGNFPS